MAESAPARVPPRRAVILAGGLGTRVQHLLPGTPKPMAPVAGRPFIDWVIRFLARQGVREIVISTGHLADVVSGYASRLRIPGVSISCAPETQLLGTAGGVLNAVASRPQGPDPWLVCNGDSLALTDLSRLYPWLQRPRVDAAMLGLRLDDASRYGSLQVGEDGLLRRFGEKQPGPGWINAGVYLFRADLLARFPPQRPLSLERDVFPGLLQQGIKIGADLAQCPFLDIGTEASLRQAASFIASHPDAFAAEKAHAS